MPSYKTREEWLTAATTALRPILEERTGMTLPKVIRLSCGWPHATPGRGVGWCYESEVSSDRSSNVFVSPTVTSPFLILAILGHELIHAADDCRSNHNGPFRKAHKAMGFVGKPTGCEAGPELQSILVRIARRLGEYPHKALAPMRHERACSGCILDKDGDKGGAR